MCQNPIDNEEIFVFLANASQRSNDLSSLNVELSPTGRHKETSHSLYSSEIHDDSNYKYR